MSQESNVFKKLWREMKMTPAYSETRSVQARPPQALPGMWLPAAKGHIAPPWQRRKETKEKKDILKMDSHKNVASPVCKKWSWNEAGLEGRPRGLFLRQNVAQKTWPRYENTQPLPRKGRCLRGTSACPHAFLVPQASVCPLTPGMGLFPSLWPHRNAGT